MTKQEILEQLENLQITSSNTIERLNHMNDAILNLLKQTSTLESEEEQEETVDFEILNEYKHLTVIRFNNEHYAIFHYLKSENCEIRKATESGYQSVSHEQDEEILKLYKEAKENV